MDQKKMPFPLRLDTEPETEVRRLANAQERSVNWVLNKLVKLGLASLAAQKENVSAVEATETLV